MNYLSFQAAFNNHSGKTAGSNQLVIRATDPLIRSEIHFLNFLQNLPKLKILLYGLCSPLIYIIPDCVQSLDVTLWPKNFVSSALERIQN